MLLVSVILDIPTQALDTPYSYLAPESLLEEHEGSYPLRVGCAVVVPFGGRQTVGFAISVEEFTQERAEELAGVKLKEIIRVVSEPYFNERSAACALFLVKEYVAPLSSCIRLFTPPGGVPKMVRAGNHWQLQAPQVGQVDDRWVVRGPEFDTFVPKKNAVRQAAIMRDLAQGELRMSELGIEYGNVSSTLSALEKKGVVQIERRRRIRMGDETAEDSVFAPTRVTPVPELTAGQSTALRTIEHAIDAHAGRVVLVDGVTGSGKTEVYLQAISKVLREGKDAIVLVPEISLTPQTVARFRGRFGDSVAVLHSAMSQGERFDQWDRIRIRDARVVVGARSALFAPVENLGLIVIDEEHEGSYKQDTSPRYVARDVAWWLAKQAGATVVLGSATPSIAALYACENDDDWTLVELPERVNGKPLPEIHVVDMAREFQQGHRSIFSRALTQVLETELAAGHKAVLLLNQRGFAKFLLCRDCGFVPECPRCSTSLTYHEQRNAKQVNAGTLTCHHCGYTTEAPVRCPKCDSPYLRKFGVGTQQVEEKLHELVNSFDESLHDVPIIRMDADTTRRKGMHQKLLEDFSLPGASILLGTQMIAKGLDFDDVTVVGVINADTMLKLPDFRAGERTFDLIEQVAGRAGRADLPGTVYVQTYMANDPAIASAARYDRDAFLADELPKRRLLEYPPYVRMANVLVWGEQAAAVRDGARQIAKAIEEAVEQADVEVSILPATPCVFEKLRNAYRWHVLLKADPAVDLSGILETVMRARKASSDYSVAIDIDPMSLL